MEMEQSSPNTSPNEEEQKKPSSEPSSPPVHKQKASAPAKTYKKRGRLGVVEKLLAKWGRGEQLTGLLVFVFIGMVLLIVVRYPLRLDLTTANINTLSQVSETLVDDLRDPIRIRVFMSPNLPPPFNTLEQSLRDILSEYRQAAGNNFYYTFYAINEKRAAEDPKMQEYIDLARDYGIAPRSIQTIDKDEVKLVNVYSGMIIEYGNVIERIEFIGDNDALEYQLSSIIKKVTDRVNTLLAATDKIDIKLYLAAEFLDLSPFFGIDSLEDTVTNLTETVDELNRENYDKLTFTHQQDTLDAETLALASKLGAQLYPWNDFTARGQSYQAGTGSAFLLVSYQDKQEVLELLLLDQVIQITGKGLERVTRYNVLPTEAVKERLEGIINNILEITPPLAYLKDKATLDLVQGSYEANLANSQSVAEGANFGSVLRSRYQLAGVTLEELTPQLYPVLMIAGPKEQFSEYELFLIDQYVMKGGSLAIFYDSFIEEPSGGAGPLAGQGIPTWVRNETGLVPLLEHYGVRIDPSIVMDRVSFVNRDQRQQGGAPAEQPIYYVPLIENRNINTNLDYLRNVKGIFFIAGSPLFPIKETLDKNNITAQALFSSSEQSWNVSEDVSLVPYLIQPPTDDKDYTTFELSYLMQGEFTSYFKDKTVPTKEATADLAQGASDDQAATTPVVPPAQQQFTADTATPALVEQAPAHAQIFLIASSEMLKNNVVDSAGKYPNAIFLLNVIDAMNGAPDWAVMRSKGQRVNPLDITIRGGNELIVWWKRPTFIKTFNLVGLPLLIVLLGLWIYSYKIRIKRRVARRFAGVATSAKAS